MTSEWPCRPEIVVLNY